MSGGAWLSVPAAPDRIAAALADTGPLGRAGRRWLAAHGASGLRTDEIREAPVLVGDTAYAGLHILYRDIAGEVRGIDRILLDPDGQVALIRPARTRIGVPQTGALHLDQPSDDLTIASRPELAVRAAATLGRPTWGVVGTVCLRKVEIPPSVTTVRLLADEEHRRHVVAMAWPLRRRGLSVRPRIFDGAGWSDG